MKELYFDFRSYADVLTPDVLETISLDAARLFAIILGKMHYRSSETIATCDGETAQRSRMPIERLLPAQRDLVKAGLFEIELDARPDFVLVARRSVYSLPAPQAAAIEI